MKRKISIKRSLSKLVDWCHPLSWRRRKQSVNHCRAQDRSYLQHNSYETVSESLPPKSNDCRSLEEKAAGGEKQLNGSRPASYAPRRRISSAMRYATFPSDYWSETTNSPQYTVHRAPLINFSAGQGNDPSDIDAITPVKECTRRSHPSASQIKAYRVSASQSQPCRKLRQTPEVYLPNGTPEERQRLLRSSPDGVEVTSLDRYSSHENLAKIRQYQEEYDWNCPLDTIIAPDKLLARTTSGEHLRLKTKSPLSTMKRSLTSVNPLDPIVESTSDLEASTSFPMLSNY